MSNVAGALLAPGTMVAGYRIEALIGRGGMGAVYRADEQGLGRKVALKVIPIHRHVSVPSGDHRRESLTIFTTVRQYGCRTMAVTSTFGVFCEAIVRGDVAQALQHGPLPRASTR